MFSFLIVAVLCTSCLAAPMMSYSYSPSVGGGSGTSFSTEGGNGRITAIRLWEASSAYITGFAQNSFSSDSSGVSASARWQQTPSTTLQEAQAKLLGPLEERELADSMISNSYSPSVGGGSGTSFSTEGGNGRIRAIRLWEASSAYITGIQVRNGAIWGQRFGRVVGSAQELILFDGETIVQVSGKYHSNYIYQIYVVTSRGRFLVVGQPTYNSFNFYPVDPKAELILLSGRFTSAGITSLGAHWDVNQNQTTYA
ncbi:zymogen granule membrane protein 16-like [Lycodopsis pacificus]